MFIIGKLQASAHRWVLGKYDGVPRPFNAVSRILSFTTWCLYLVFFIFCVYGDSFNYNGIFRGVVYIHYVRCYLAEWLLSTMIENSGNEGMRDLGKSSWSRVNWRAHVPVNVKRCVAKVLDPREALVTMYIPRIPSQFIVPSTVSGSKFGVGYNDEPNFDLFFFSSFFFLLLSLFLWGRHRVDGMIDVTIADRSLFLFIFVGRMERWINLEHDVRYYCQGDQQ